MAKTDFQKSVDAAAADVDQQNAAAERGKLERMLPLLAGVLEMGRPTVEAIDYVLEKVPATEPGVTALRQTRQVIQNTLGGEFDKMTARLAELSEDPAEGAESEAS